MKKLALGRRLLVVCAGLILFLLTTTAFADFNFTPAALNFLAPENFLIPDGDFEEDPSTVWLERDTTNCTPWIIDDDLVGGTPSAFSGGRYLFAGGACGPPGGAEPNSNSAEQFFIVDPNNTMVSFWYYTLRNDADSTITDDFGYVEINDTRIWEISLTQAQNSNGWVNVELDLSAYLNDTIKFEVGADNGEEPGIGNIFFDFIEFVGSEPAAPAITINKNPAAQNILSGGTANFDIEVENTGNVTLYDLVIDDPLAPESCGFEVTELLVGATVSNSCEIAGVTESFTNTATVTARDLLDTEVSAVDTATVTVDNPDISIDITPDSQMIIEGTTAFFTVEVTNTGNQTLNSTQVDSDSVVDCDFSMGQLSPGQTKSRDCEAVNVDQSFLNTVTATANNGGGVDVSADDSAFVDVINVNLDIRIESEMPTVLKDERVQFDVTIENLGAIDLEDIEITDNLAPNCNLNLDDLEAGESFSYGCQSPKVTAPFNNIIVATANLASTTGTTDDSDTIEINVLDLNVEATAVNSQLPPSGGDVEMNIKITNTGSKGVEITQIVAGVLNGQTDPNPLPIKNSSCQTNINLAANAMYSCSFEVVVALNPGSHQLGVAAEALYKGQTAVTDVDSVNITISVPPTRRLLLPLMLRNHIVSEPNDTCGTAYRIAPNQSYQFLPDDIHDWYEFTLTEPGHLTVELTNFVPVNGQIILYSGTCNTATLLQNNGDFLTTKIIDVGQRPAGNYILWLINDGPLNNQKSYNLIVRSE